jgi:hypothetical protein
MISWPSCLRFEIRGEISTAFTWGIPRCTGRSRGDNSSREENFRKWLADASALGLAIVVCKILRSNSGDKERYLAHLNSLFRMGIAE